MKDLQITRLRKSFAESVVVDDVSLQVAPGEFLALLGPSGCGKTTMLRMIAGFETPDSGHIRMGGQVFFDSTQGVLLRPEARRLGMVFQSYALWPHMTVFANVAYPLKIAGVDKAEQERRVSEILEQTGLCAHAARYPRAMSGGQQQRVALARSLVTRPQLILLDEPLANLDRHLRASMQETFRAFNRDSGATFIYVTHDQHEAMAMADKIAVMRDGRLLQHDAPERMYRQPENAWVAGFIGEGCLVSIAAESKGVFLHDAQAQQAFAAGQRGQGTLQALIRPEQVQMVSAGVAASVEHSRFLGERYLLSLRLSSGERLQAYHTQGYAAGECVQVQVHGLWILPEQPE